MVPHATEKLGEWREARSRAGRMLVAVDFDGTLAPIVERPEAATIHEEGPAVLRELAARPDTLVAVVSGRVLADVRARVGVGEVYYAGNHGMEIAGPDLAHVLPEAAEARPQLEDCVEGLRAALAAVPGVILEDKGLTLSVHYRLVTDPEVAADVRVRVAELCGAFQGLRITEGKEVVEVRPDVAWDKGRATRFLLDSLLGPAAAGVPVLFIGDDRTDEDAFRAVRDGGAGILVAPRPPLTTAATAHVRDPGEVVALLRDLARSDPATEGGDA